MKGDIKGDAPDSIARILRVDHAGEYGAVRIYDGQAAVLRHASGAGEAFARIEEMRAEEARHLAVFSDLLRERGVRPSALLPLWDVAGFALGAMTALMGSEAAMSCTVAVEEVIDEHYASQIVELEGLGEESLRGILEAFRADEVSHRGVAEFYGGVGVGLLGGFVRLGCRAAILLSTRI